MFSRKRYLNRLISCKDNNLIKIITGVRRAGKSYLLNEIFYTHLLESGVHENNVIRFAFDSAEDIDILDEYFPEMPTTTKDKAGHDIVNSKKFRSYIKSVTNDTDKFYLLLDEIQLLDGFVSTLNGLLRHHNFDIYVTGSNSKFLSSDIVTEFKGRSSEIHVLPLVFSEYCEGLNLTPDVAWRRYIITGGIPIVALMNSDEERMSYLKNLCQETYLKDIIERNKIRKKGEIGDVFDILASMIGSPLNITKIVNTFVSAAKKEITDDTIADFVEYFQDSFVISKARKYNIKGRKYRKSPFKIYFEDIGVRNARLNFRQIEETHIMENILYNELRYRGYNVDVGEVTINEKTDRIDINGKAIYAAKSLEVDFIATSGSEKFYIQSALDMTSPEKQIQEKKSLYYIDDSFKKVVITKNGLGIMRDDIGVETIDLFDFLLGQEM